jgi:hypothetical protein
MSNKKTSTDKKATSKSKDEFQPTFVKYKELNDREKSIFRQGATTANNSIKERLGLKKPREKK